MKTSFTLNSPTNFPRVFLLLIACQLISGIPFLSLTPQLWAVNDESTLAAGEWRIITEPTIPEEETGDGGNGCPSEQVSLDAEAAVFDQNGEEGYYLEGEDEPIQTEEIEAEISGTVSHTISIRDSIGANTIEGTFTWSWESKSGESDSGDGVLKMNYQRLTGRSCRTANDDDGDGDGDGDGTNNEGADEEDVHEDCTNPNDTEILFPFVNEDNRNPPALLDANPTRIEVVSENIHSSLRKHGINTYSVTDPPQKYLVEIAQTSLQGGSPESAVGGTVTWMVHELSGQSARVAVSGNPSYYGHRRAGGGGSPTTFNDSYSVQGYDDCPNNEADEPGVMTVNAQLMNENTTEMLIENVSTIAFDFKDYYRGLDPRAYLRLNEEETSASFQKTRYKWRIPADQEKYPRPYTIEWVEIFEPFDEDPNDDEFPEKEFFVKTESISEGVESEIHEIDPSSTPDKLGEWSVMRIEYEIVEIQEDGSEQVVEKAPISSPSPDLNVGVSASNLEVANDGALTIDLRLTGTITDPVAGITDPEGSYAGQFMSSYMQVNGVQHLLNPTEEHLEETQEASWNRYRYEATMNESVNVAVFEGANVIRIRAYNSAGQEGYADFTVEVNSVGGSAGGEGTSAFVVTGIPSFTPDSENTIGVYSSSFGLSATFTNSTSEPTVYTYARGNEVFNLSLGDLNNIDDSFPVLLSEASSGSSVSSILYAEGNSRWASPPSAAPPGSPTFEVGVVAFVEKSNPGAFRPCLLRLKDGERLKGLLGKNGEIRSEFKETVRMEETFADPTGYESSLDSFDMPTPFAEERLWVKRISEGSDDGDGHLYVSGTDMENPGLLVFAVSAPRSSGPAVGFDFEGATDFAGGFGRGFVDGGLEVISDGKGILNTVGNGLETAAGKIGTAFSLILKGDVGGIKARVESNARSVVRGVSDAKQFVDVAWQFLSERVTNDAGYLTEWLIGDPSKLGKLGEEGVERFSYTAKLLDDIGEAIENSSNEEKGYFMGRAMFEITTLPIGYLKLGKLRFLEKLRNSPLFRRPELSSVASKLNTTIATLRTSKMCFVAGTMVITADRIDASLQELQAIETIQVGDLVWSQPESGGGSSEPKRVLQTFETHPTTLYHLSLDHDHDGEADQEITGTGEHPFWRADLAEWTPLREIQPHQTVRLLSGRSSFVLSNQRQDAPLGETFTTYNFEVEDFHTYFVGESGVWVHNFSDRFCETFFSIAEQAKKNLGITAPKGRRFEILEESLDDIVRGGQKIDSQTGNHFMHVTQYEEFADYTGDLASIATVKQLRALKSRHSAGGFNHAGGFEIHHTAEKWISNRLGIADNVLDDAPGIPLRKKPNAEYDATYREKFGHDPAYHGGSIEDGGLAANLNSIRSQLDNGTIDLEQMLTKVKQLYESPAYRETNMWPVTRDWLRQHAADPSIIPD